MSSLAGLRIYDKTGNIILDGTTRPPKILGTFNTGITAGSFTIISEEKNIKYFFYANSIYDYVNQEFLRKHPRVYLSGNIIYWDWKWLSPSQGRLPLIVFYGAY